MSSPTPDYYSILGVSPSASLTEIKAAYRRLALQWHPDKNPHQIEVAEEKFKLIGEAFSTLSDEDKRRDFDNRDTTSPGDFFSTHNNTGFGFHRNNSRSQQHHPFHRSAFSFASANDIFRQFFGGRDPFADFFHDDPFNNPYFHNNSGGSLFNQAFGTSHLSRGDPFAAHHSLMTSMMSGFGGGFDTFHAGGLASHSSTSSQSITYGPNGEQITKTTTTRTVNGKTTTETTTQIHDHSGRLIQHMTDTGNRQIEGGRRILIEGVDYDGETAQRAIEAPTQPSAQAAMRQAQRRKPSVVDLVEEEAMTNNVQQLEIDKNRRKSREAKREAASVVQDQPLMQAPASVESRRFTRLSPRHSVEKSHAHRKVDTSVRDRLTSDRLHVESQSRGLTDDRSKSKERFVASSIEAAAKESATKRRDHIQARRSKEASFTSSISGIHTQPPINPFLQSESLPRREQDPKHCDQMNAPKYLAQFRDTDTTQQQHQQQQQQQQQSAFHPLNTTLQQQRARY